MSKKQLDTQNVLSELTGQSAFFPKDASTPTKTTSIQPEPNTSTERTDIRTEIRSEKRTGLLPLKRLTRRYSFEFYNDQITKLKGIKHDYEMMGENVTMSDIVREALDEYLSAHNRTENRSDLRTNGNPNE
jgi:hypothetical protein